MRLTKGARWFVLGLLLVAAQPSIAQDKPYKEGTVWSVSFIKVKPGMFDVYMRDLAVQRKKLMDEAKKQGLIVSERMLVGTALTLSRSRLSAQRRSSFKRWSSGRRSARLSEGRHSRKSRSSSSKAGE